jgi:disulfide bond formation protein DsbB
MFDRRQKINLLCALACAGMMGYALYAEKVLGLLPCPLCMFQRVCIVVLGIVFLVAGLHPAKRVGSMVYAALTLIAAGAAIFVSGRHVWVQSQPAGSVPSCGAPLDSLLQMFPLLEVVRKVMTGGGECARIDWTFLGLTMPKWVLIASALLLVVGVVNNARRPARAS